MVEDQHVVGIVTDRYLTVRVAAKRMDPNDVRPQDVLTKAGQTVSPNAELSDARARMSERGFARRQGHGPAIGAPQHT